MPMMPALFIFAGLAAVELVRRIARSVADRSARGPVWRALVLFLGLFLFINLPVRAVASSWAYKLAHAIGISTRLETSSSAHFNLGVAYAALAKDSEESDRLLGLAEEQLRTALQQDDRWAQVYVELGKVLARQARNREAIELYHQAAEIEPGLYRVHHSLGLLYTRLEDWASAEAAFRTALEIQPRHTVSATRLGEALLKQGRLGAAAEAFRYTLKLSPGDLAAREGLQACEP